MSVEFLNLAVDYLHEQEVQALARGNPEEQAMISAALDELLQDDTLVIKKGEQ